ncbi:hypothetical protein CANMA_004498 [Candida margitis]|uniref:uncharacterized protein n=1 Tax=Candida margitis TaxID=1775924 RepID=UPI002226DAD0|nr:uncharacterized protein CANMA_004498 [Candida margitis]KAI5956661.1 hypothetical protein CANMA_004498 [Candida margitis]
MKTSRRLGAGKPRRGRTSKSSKPKPTSPTPRDHNLPHHSRSIFARDNKLSSLFSSQSESTPDPTTRRSNQLPYADEDEVFFERDSSPPLDIRRKRRSITPPSQFQNELAYDSRKQSDSLYNDMFYLSKPKSSTKSRKQSTRNSHKTSQERLKSQLQSPLKGHNEILPRNDVQKSNSQGTRRLSYNSRGRRVSSMGNGFEGEPHQDVPVSEYYKHLDKSIPESDRMRQLLIWNLKAELDKEENDLRNKSDQVSTENHTINNIAKTINDELIQSLKDYSISTDWKEGDSRKTDSVLLPNPKNKENLRNIRKYSTELTALKREKQEWESAYLRLTSLIDTMAKETEGFAKDFEKVYSPSEASVDPTFVNMEQNYLDVRENLKRVAADVESLSFAAQRMGHLAEMMNNEGKEELRQDISNLLKKSLPKSSPQPSQKPSEAKDILRAICLCANAK